MCFIFSCCIRELFCKRTVGVIGRVYVSYSGFEVLIS